MTEESKPKEPPAKPRFDPKMRFACGEDCLYWTILSDGGALLEIDGMEEGASIFLLPKQVHVLMDWIRSKKEGLRSPFEPLH